MSESAPEITPHVEAPQPGSLTAVRRRIGDALVIAVRTEQETSSDREKTGALKLQQRHLWQLGMLDSLVSRRMSEIASVDPDQTEKKMTAREGATRLQAWITEVLDSDKHIKDSEGDLPEDVTRGYAEDLLVKLSHEASSAHSSI